MGMMRREGRVLQALHKDRSGVVPTARTAFPQGSIAPQARVGSDPRHRREEWDKHSPPGQFFDKKRGALTAPLYAQEAESGFASRRPKRNRVNEFRERSRRPRTRISTKMRGLNLVAYERDPGDETLLTGVGPVPRSPDLPKARRCSLAVLRFRLDDTPWSSWPSPWRAAGSRSEVRYFRSLLPRLRLAVPNPAARCARRCCGRGQEFPPDPDRVSVSRARGIRSFPRPITGRC